MNRQSPLISIVTITFNAAKEITPTLESLNSQNYRDFEHIVIDGASSDDTLRIVRQLSASSRILSEKDKGLYDAMNKGLRLATGRYVIFLNAGDAFHATDTLQLYADAIESNASSGNWPDIVYGDTDIVDSKRQFLSKRHLSVPDRLTFRSFADGMLVCHQAFMVKKELAPDYNLDYRFSADYEWTLKCIKASDPDRNVNLHAVTIDYLSDGLTDKNHMASLKERFKIMAQNYGLLPTTLRHLKFLLLKIIGRRQG